ncbi:uncharacterized protein DFL_008129 [Arthrobotrys flagrans]|uniref:AA9 family lytic polysaccharide monooxygenase n=1 Tax=Arthrobotrys flagrans TaxID=97331 RepID=A0A436ZMU6_ARTFL|nr:hypothetical protein DFL_008129 [Arthrobotrys flagrans]
MNIITFFLVSLLVSVSMAHHVITHFFVDNVRHNNVIRQPGTLNPIINPNDKHLACGFPIGNGQGIKGTDKAVVQPGSNITFEWHTDWSASVSSPEGVTDVSHKGPCAIYMRKVSDSVTAIAEDPRKPNWFKIWEDGVDQDGMFCTSRMRLNGGLFTGVVPKHLENGDYLIRAETITLNNAGKPNWQPQCCAQVTLKNSEAPFIKPVTVPIPSGDYANMNMPGLRYNIWHLERTDYSDYGPIPGPAVFNDGSDKAQHPVKVPQQDQTLPDGFATIPWPTSSETTRFVTKTHTVNIPTTSTSTYWITSILPPESETHTRVLTKTVTQQVIQTVYVTGPPKPPTMRHRIPHRHTNTVTITRIATVTRTFFDAQPPTQTSFTNTVDPVPDVTTLTTSSRNHGTIVGGRGYHYRRSHHRHVAGE